jgi:peptidoglycan/LPS O-acetylase OafA/YrhL
MYLAHPVATAAVRRLTRDITVDDSLSFLLSSVFIVVCCVVVGKVYYELVERHFLNTSPTARAPKLEPLPVAAEGGIVAVSPAASSRSMSNDKKETMTGER